MSLKITVLIVCAVLIYNIYYETNLFKNIKKYQKYYKIGIVLVFGMGILKTLNKSSLSNVETLQQINQFIQGIPLDKQSKDLLTPFFNTPYQQYNAGVIHQQPNVNHPIHSIKRIENQKSKTTKRSVSETKKKYVASLQNWQCKHCKCQLSAWFEVDHRLRLDQGGTNDVSNLEALCRECHGKKTSMENMK